MTENTTTAAAGYDLDELLGTKVGDMTKSEPLPEGVYHVRIGKAVVTHPKQSTKKDKSGQDVQTYPYVNWDLVVTGDSPEEFHGRHTFDMGSLKPGATFTNRQYLEALGYGEDVTLGEALPEINAGNSELLVGLVVEPEGISPADNKWYPARNKITRRLKLGS
jgi:hypothetical protein